MQKISNRCHHHKINSIDDIDQTPTITQEIRHSFSYALMMARIFFLLLLVPCKMLFRERLWNMPIHKYRIKCIPRTIIT